MHSTSPNSTDTIRIIADDRERSAPVIAVLQAMDGIDLAVERLIIGDYLVGRNLLIERKTVTDFVLALLSGRLFRQAWRLTRCSCPRRCFVVEGSFADPRYARLPRHALQGAMITVTLVFGLPVIRSRTPEETAHILRMAGRQLHRRRLPPMRLHTTTHREAPTTQLLMLLGVRDIGPTRASALLEQFGNLRAIATATTEELASVSGVGPKTARRLNRAFTDTPSHKEL
jgi:ERCC4-type nuclease